MMSPLFLLPLFPFLAHTYTVTEPSHCEEKKISNRSPTKEAAGNCSVEGGSSWEGNLRTRQYRTGISIDWQNLLQNQTCVNGIRLFLDGELKNSTQLGHNPEKLEIQYNNPKCMSYSVQLTIEVEAKNKSCYKASQKLSHKFRLNKTQRQACLQNKAAQDELRKIEMDDQSEKDKETALHEDMQQRRNETLRTFQSLPNITMSTESLPNITTESSKALQPNVNSLETPNTMEIEGKNDGEVNVDSSLIVIGSISFMGGLVVMLVLLGIGYLVRRKRRRGKFNVQQSVDLNFTYGTYSDYYSDYNTVEDTNPYYSSHL